MLQCVQKSRNLLRDVFEERSGHVETFSYLTGARFPFLGFAQDRVAFCAERRDAATSEVDRRFWRIAVVVSLHGCEVLERPGGIRRLNGARRGEFLARGQGGRATTWAKKTKVSRTALVIRRRLRSRSVRRRGRFDARLPSRLPGELPRRGPAPHEAHHGHRPGEHRRPLCWEWDVLRGAPERCARGPSSFSGWRAPPKPSTTLEARRWRGMRGP